MWFIEKVAILFLAQFVMIPRTHTKPYSFLNKNQAKGNNRYTPKISDTYNESILKAFNFHDIEYPVAATPRPQQFYLNDFDNNQSPLKYLKTDTNNLNLKPANNRTSLKLQKFIKNKSNVNKPKSVSVLTKAFTSDPDFRDVGLFPDVEYPLNAKETWKPNYWSIPSDCKDLKAILSEDLQVNQNLANVYPTRNLGISAKLGKYPSFSIKSFSDSTKNKKRLKQILEYNANNSSNKQDNSNCQNDFIENSRKKLNTNSIKTLAIEETARELPTTPMPYCFTPIDFIPDCEEFNTVFFASNILSAFDKSNSNNSNSSTPTQNVVTPNTKKTKNQFTDNRDLNLQNKNTIQKYNNNDRRDESVNNSEEMKYDLYDIIDIRKTDNSNDLCGLDEDYTTGIYSEEIIGFSQPISTPKPFSTKTIDLMWKNCKTITPHKFDVDELNDYYIAV